MAPQRLVVVGNGMAGLRLLEEIVERAPGRFAITVIGAEPEPAYNRVLLSSLLAGEIGADDVMLRPRDWYGTHGIELITGQPAQCVDIMRRALRLPDGTEVAFDALVLATGSDPVTLPVPGTDLAGVVTFRTLADIAGFETFASTGQPAVVIGGGVLGIEAAYGLARRGVPVTLVHLMDRLMERQLDAEGAELVAQAVAQKGIRVLLNAKTRAIHGESRAEAVELTDGRVLPCGLVVMAIGVRPRIALAATAGLKVNRGIVVDDLMRTSVPSVFAVGECAEHCGTCYGLVEPCYQQAKAAATTILGDTSADYAGSVPAIHLKVSGVPVFSIGDFDGTAADRIIIRDGGAPCYRKLVMREGRLAGAILVGDSADAAWYTDLVRSGAPVAALREQLAFGRAFAEAA